ncbi:MAG: hemerythrin domain-containing protein [Holophagae bacterium]|jgi:hemerythrin-like domain-containing protein
MRIIDEVRIDHRLIDRVTGSLMRWSDRGVDHAHAAGDKDDLVRFLRVCVEGRHHSTEEVLFRALVEHGEIPGDRGPLAVLRREHGVVADAVDRLDAAGLDPTSVDLARTLASDLWQHLDKEESVLLPEAERRLIDGGIRELADPPLSAPELAVRDLGRTLIERLPPMDHPDLIRGAGCIACAAFGEDCHGIETEWWSDWERMHYRSLDEG